MVASPPDERSRVRLRAPVTVGVLVAGTLAYVWFVSTAIRQMQVLASMIAIAAGLFVIAFWFVFLSAAPRRIRWSTAGVLVSVFALGASLFRIRGVTGDFIPIVEYRFPAPVTLPEAPPQSAVVRQPVRESEASAPSTSGSVTGRDAKEATATAPSAPPDSAATKPAAKAKASHVDWPQFLGPSRTGVVDGMAFETDWTNRPPRLLWRQPVGQGWAGFSVRGDIAVTQEQREDGERVIAYELRTGRPIWSHVDKGRHDSPLGGVGPRAVPAIDGGQVFAMGAMGALNALDLETGRLLWSKNILSDNGSGEPTWGVSVSPMIVGSRVVVSVGGSSGRALVAYDRSSGERAWSAGEGGLSYSSPVLLTLGGREQIVMLNSSSVAGHDPETGAQLWTHDFPGGQPNVATPLRVSDNRVLFSVGYGIGSRVFELQSSADGALSPRLIWSTPRLKSKFANVVAFEGSVYGLDDGVLTCIDPQTGERRWKEGRFGHGQLILAGRHLMVQTEDGEIILIDPSPEKLIEKARFRALNGKTWNPPAFAAPILLVRNDLEAAAFDLSVR